MITDHAKDRHAYPHHPGAPAQMDREIRLW